MKKSELFEKCERLEQHVCSKRLATDEELAQYRPARGRAAPMEDWVWWYAQLVGFCRRIEQKELDAPDADGRALRILREQPVRVPVSTGEEFFVYPKSFEALLIVHALDGQIAWMLSRYHYLREHPENAQHVALIEDTARALADRESLLIWIATHPGVWVPPELDDPDAPIPERVRALSAVDRMQIYQPFMQVNSTDLQILERLITPARKDGTGRPSWSVFAASLNMKWDGDIHLITRHRSLLSLLATVQLSAPTGVGVDGAPE